MATSHISDTTGGLLGWQRGYQSSRKGVEGGQKQDDMIIWPNTLAPYGLVWPEIGNGGSQPGNGSSNRNYKALNLDYVT